MVCGQFSEFGAEVASVLRIAEKLEMETINDRAVLRLLARTIPTSAGSSAISCARRDLSRGRKTNSIAVAMDVPSPGAHTARPLLFSISCTSRRRRELSTCRRPAGRPSPMPDDGTKAMWRSTRVVSALEMGADDYLASNRLGPRELLARILARCCRPRKCQRPLSATFRRFRLRSVRH